MEGMGEGVMSEKRLMGGGEVGIGNGGRGNG